MTPRPPQTDGKLQHAIKRQKAIHQRLKAEIEAGLATEAVDYPESLFNSQELCRMPRGKKDTRIDFLADKETVQALQSLLDFYGPDVKKSEIIREAIIEKAKRDVRRKQQAPPKD